MVILMVKVKEVIPMDRIRKRIAEKMSQSYREIPHVTLITEVDVTELSKIREELKSKGYNISYTDIIIMAAAISLKDYPMLNSRLDNENITIFDEVNINIAVDTDYGLITPVVKNVDKKSLLEVSRDVRDIVDRARKRKLTISDVTGGTFTVTNLGMYDIYAFTPIINHPQVGILGIGKIYSQMIMKNGELSERKVMNLCLSFDHRVIDGGPAARFLKRIKELLEEPASWIYSRLM